LLQRGDVRLVLGQQRLPQLRRADLLQLPDQGTGRLPPQLPLLPGPEGGHVAVDVHDGAELALEALELGVDLGGVAHGPERTPGGCGWPVAACATPGRTMPGMLPDGFHWAPRC